ncbi:E3 ubiquitin-protein ligase RNF169 [Sorex araneus]|uniref:E3 ubiquitin-protein ligase RNF169 n=1 Tax=Sorex araneus TaxID=42254 RepID=UPI0024334D6C|nr:E3 ubiquitin-protein ligase RNF169 [Sorex araneus]
MAAAGPSTRGCAAAAALARRRRRGRWDEAAAAPSGASPRPEEPGCAGCRGSPRGAAALPCGHSLCRGCAQRAAAGPGCPRCRRRARRDGQAEARAERAAAAAGPGPEQEPRAEPAEPEFIFRAPIKLSKPGELREEYESLRKLREEKLQEEKTSDDQIHKLLPEDTETGKRKMEEQKKREEPLALKTNLEHCPARLSDSENEEPSRGKMTQTHRSAFVSKNNSYSLAFLAGNLNSKVERSQSCSDTAQDRAKSRLRGAPTRKAKGASLTLASTPIIGVLLSTQNSRCLSAPDLALEKRLPFSSLSSVAALHKPERSISPESNDSISEELNHFKPIVCSPCTPPKRLPDGRVLSPLIIKSTPRNLSRSLQKQTSYEASPRILKKWEQIFQERQIKKTLCKATLTSLAPEPPAEDVVLGPGLAPAVNAEKPPLALPARLPGRQALPEGDPNPRPPAPLGTPAPERATPEAHFHKTCPSTARKVLAASAGPPSGGGGVGTPRTRKQPAPPLDLPNGLGAAEPPRRGRKRRAKAKPEEQNGPLKRPRGRRGQRLQQEEEDRRLALRLQRLFDSQRRTVSRRKGSGDQYLLRSSVAGAK